MTKLQYLKQVLDKPIYGMPWFPKIQHPTLYHRPSRQRFAATSLPKTYDQPQQSHKSTAALQPITSRGLICPECNPVRIQSKNNTMTKQARHHIIEQLEIVAIKLHLLNPLQRDAYGKD